MSDLGEEDFESYLGEQDDPDDVDAPAYYDKDGFALAVKSFSSQEKNQTSCLALL